MRLCIGLLGIFVLLSTQACISVVNVEAEAEMSRNGHAETGFINKSFKSGDKTFRYVVYVPREYSPDKEWPLVVFLHGAGERGDDGLIQSEVGIGRAIRRNPERFPAIVLMPQCPKDVFWSVILDKMEKALERTRSEYSIDEQRITLTGLSMGGYGTWLWGAKKSDTFAALMPICGGGSFLAINARLGKPGENPFGEPDDRVKALATVPIWAFHGADDEVVSPDQSRSMVKLVKEAGGEVKYTEYENTGHNSWDQAYGDKNAIQWLLRQRKK